MAHWDSAQGQAKVAKITQNTPTCDVHPRKAHTQNEKCVFFSMSIRRLAESVKGLNSSLAAGDLWPKKARQYVGALKG